MSTQTINLITINIKPIKDNFTFEDIEKAFNAGTNWKEKYWKIVDDELVMPDFNKWFESNL